MDDNNITPTVRGREVGARQGRRNFFNSASPLRTNIRSSSPPIAEAVHVPSDQLVGQLEALEDEISQLSTSSSKRIKDLEEEVKKLKTQNTKLGQTILKQDAVIEKLIKDVKELQKK